MLYEQEESQFPAFAFSALWSLFSLNAIVMIFMIKISFLSCPLLPSHFLFPFPFPLPLCMQTCVCACGGEVFQGYTHSMRFPFEPGAHCLGTRPAASKSQCSCLPCSLFPGAPHFTFLCECQGSKFGFPCRKASLLTHWAISHPSFLFSCVSVVEHAASLAPDTAFLFLLLSWFWFCSQTSIPTAGSPAPSSLVPMVQSW